MRRNITSLTVEGKKEKEASVICMAAFYTTRLRISDTGSQEVVKQKKTKNKRKRKSCAGGGGGGGRWHAKPQHPRGTHMHTSDRRRSSSDDFQSTSILHRLQATHIALRFHRVETVTCLSQYTENPLWIDIVTHIGWCVV